jgi:hypothetical protein
VTFTHYSLVQLIISFSFFTKENQVLATLVHLAIWTQHGQDALKIGGLCYEYLPNNRKVACLLRIGLKAQLHWNCGGKGFHSLEVVMNAKQCLSLVEENVFWRIFEESYYK